MWDTVQGFNQDYFYSQQYLQSKHGVILVGDAIKLVNEDQGSQAKVKEIRN